MYKNDPLGEDFKLISNEVFRMKQLFRQLNPKRTALTPELLADVKMTLNTIDNKIDSLWYEYANGNACIGNCQNKIGGQ